MILALRFPYWMIYALGVPVKDIARTVVTERGLVAQAGRRAELSGVKTGMDIEKARSLFTDLHVADRSRVLEEAWRESVTACVYGIVPRVEDTGAGIWLVYCDDLQRRTLLELPSLKPAHAGYAADRNTAILSSLRAAEGHCLVIEGHKRHAFFENTAVDVLSGFGISEETIMMLRWTGFDSLKKASALSARQLRLQFGSDGLVLQRLFSPPGEAYHVAWHVPAPEIRFEAGLTWSELTTDLVRQLADAAAPSLFAQLDGKGFQVLTLQVLEPDDEPLHKVLKEPVFKEDRLHRLLLKELPPVLPASVSERKLVVRARALKSAEGPVGDLFARPGLDQALKRAERRFPGRVFGFQPVPHALFPEQAFRTAPKTAS